MSGVRPPEGRGQARRGEAVGGPAPGDDGAAARAALEAGGLRHRVERTDTIASVRATYYPDDPLQPEVTGARRDDALRHVLETTRQLPPGAELAKIVGFTIYLPTPESFAELAKELDKIGGLRDGLAGARTAKLIERAARLTGATVVERPSPVPHSPSAKSPARPGATGAKGTAAAGVTARGKSKAGSPRQASSKGKRPDAADAGGTARGAAEAPLAREGSGVRRSAAGAAAERQAANAAVGDHLARLAELARGLAAHGVAIDAQSLATRATIAHVTAAPDFVSALGHVPPQSLEHHLTAAALAAFPMDREARDQFITAARGFLEERLPHIATEQLRSHVLTSLAETEHTYARLLAAPEALGLIADAIAAAEDRGSPKARQVAATLREGFGLHGVALAKPEAVHEALERRRDELREAAEELAASTASPTRDWQELSRFIPEEDAERETLRQRLGIQRGSCLDTSLEEVRHTGKMQHYAMLGLGWVAAATSTFAVSILTAGAGGLAAGITGSALMGLPDLAETEAAVTEMRALVSAGLAPQGAADAAELAAVVAPATYVVGIGLSTWVGHVVGHAAEHGALQPLAAKLGPRGVAVLEAGADVATHTTVDVLGAVLNLSAANNPHSDPSYQALLHGLQDLRDGPAAAGHRAAIDGAFADAGVPPHADLRAALLGLFLVDPETPRASHDLRARLGAWLRRSVQPSPG